MKRSVLHAAWLSAFVWASAPDAALAEPSTAPAGLWMPVGANVGAAFHAGGIGLVFGGEASVVSHGYYYDLWFGGYTDFLYDDRLDRFRLSMGPEIGWKYFGVDAGYLAEIDVNGNDETHHGFTIRPMVSLGAVSLTLRYGHVFGSKQAENFGELGALLKLPIPLKPSP